MDADEYEILGEPSRQAPLSLRWETRQHWETLRAEFDVCETGAAIILALLTEHRAAGRWVSYSRHKPHYSQPRRYQSRIYSYRRVVGAVDRLEESGLIQHDKSGPNRRGWQSSMIPTPELVERAERILSTAPPLVIARPPSLIVLRDAEGALLDFRDTGLTRRMTRAAEKINEAIRSTEITGSAAAPMVRIFNRSFGRGGRFYALGGGWQSMKKEMRRQVEIAGEPVVEIDYKTLHPAILYAQAGAPLPEDCYAIEGWPRPLVKVALLILVNAKTRAAARLAIAHHKTMADVAPLGSQEALAAADRLIDTIKTVHRPIAGAFHSDKGAELMMLDSTLAETVMHMMLRQGVLVLPVHDSFLVPASKADLLEEAMIRAAHEAGILAIEVDRKTANPD